jgi:hypothetical protein
MTRPYLDPFLGPPRRLRYDAAAERFAAAVTLYEMATGTLPRWGDDANPAAISDEVTLDPASFDPAVADRLVAFFARTLARDAAGRFDTAEEMEDAWRVVFVDLPEEASAGPGGPGVTRESPLETAGLTPRARSALERLGVYTVRELLAYEPARLTRAAAVPDATRREIRDRTRALRAELTAAPAPALAAGGQPRPHSIEALAGTLLPKLTGRTAREHDTLRALLGQAATPDGSFLRWPTQSEAARAIGQAQPQISGWLRKQTDRWQRSRALAQVRDEIVTLLDQRGRVMSARELAEALIAARGSYAVEPQRVPQATGLVRAAVETELALGGDARLAIQRFRSSGTVLVGREPDDPAAVTTAADLLEYGVRLGRRGADLVTADPLPTRQRAVEQLRAVAAPDGVPMLDDERLLQLAAEATEEADLNAQGQLYPVGMPPDRALRLAAGNLAGRYVPPPTPGLMTSTRMTSSSAPLAGPDAAAEVDGRLATVFARGGFLAMLAPRRLLAPARRALLERLPLVEVDVTAILLNRLRNTGYPWQDVLAADTGDPADENFRALVDLVRHEVIPQVRRTLATTEPVLLTAAAPLARYGQLELLRELTDLSRPRPAARLLLVPARQPGPAKLDREPLPLTSPASQSLWLPEPWISAQPAGRTLTR